MRDVVLPYQNLGQNLTLTLTKSVLDASSLTLTPDTDGNIDLTAHRNWSVLEIEARVAAPPAATGAAAPQVVIVAYSAGSEFRAAFAATRSTADPTVWSASVKLYRSLLAGAIRLDATMSATIDGVGGRILAWSDSLTVVFDESHKPPRQFDSFLTIRWVDFSDTSVYGGALAKFRQELFYPAVNAEPPTMFLNREVKALDPFLMDGKVRRGADLVMHNFLRSAMASKTWAALYGAAVAAIEPGDDSDEPTPPQGWKGELVRKLIERLYEGETESDALTALTEGWRTGNGNVLSEIFMIAEETARSASFVRGALLVLTEQDPGEFVDPEEVQA